MQVRQGVSAGQLGRGATPAAPPIRRPAPFAAATLGGGGGGANKKNGPRAAQQPRLTGGGVSGRPHNARRWQPNWPGQPAGGPAGRGGAPARRQGPSQNGAPAARGKKKKRHSSLWPPSHWPPARAGWEGGASPRNAWHGVGHVPGCAAQASRAACRGVGPPAGHRRVEVDRKKKRRVRVLSRWAPLSLLSATLPQENSLARAGARLYTTTTAPPARAQTLSASSLCQLVPFVSLIARGGWGPPPRARAPLTHSLAPLTHSLRARPPPPAGHPFSTHKSRP